jgi:peptidoglycan DL-endopeptidase CwlO
MRVRSYACFGAILALTVTLLPAAPALAAPSINEVRAQVERLQQEAADAAEGANDAKVRLAALNKRLSSLQGARAVQDREITALRSSIGRIAANAYRSGGLGEGVGLLFSDDPTQYLSSAGVLDALSRSQQVALRKYSQAQQSLTRTSLVVEDQVRQVVAAERELKAKAAAAQSKLAAAERLLASLSVDQRRRIVAAQRADQAQAVQSARGLLARAAQTPGRAGKAIRFAIAQMGDRYVFGAAGMSTWDCSGLTMRAYRDAGVSLPHSSKAQYNYGKRISRSELQPGDLVFFYSPISHVGIYIGNNLMIHAPRPGYAVGISDFGTRRWAGAIRL